MIRRRQHSATFSSRIVPKHRILVIDDDRLALRALRRALSKEYDVKTATSGEEALEIISSFRPDLILLDILMPGMDGYEICRTVRSKKNLGLTKIIMLSGKAVVEERLEGYRAGADDYISKPFNTDELKAKIRVFLRLKRIEEVDRIKSDLIALFSHETKTPLSEIIGLSEIIKNDKSFGQKEREYSKIIHRSGLDLLEFVRKTTFLCELKNGLEPDVSIDSVAKHIRQLASFKEIQYIDKKVTVHLQIDKDGRLKVDWSMIDRVFDYILDNAVKFSPDGAEVHVRTIRTKNAYNVYVIDQGEGIESDWIEKIFDEFAIKTIIHHNRGQGLSLAICKNIIELHDGELQVESAPGDGTTFTISFPNTRVVS